MRCGLCKGVWPDWHVGGARKVHVFIEIRSDTGKLCGVYKSMNFVVGQMNVPSLVLPLTSDIIIVLILTPLSLQFPLQS